MFVLYDEFVKVKGGFVYKVVLNDGWKEFGSEFSIIVNVGKKVKINGKDYMVIYKVFVILDDFRIKKCVQFVF